MSMSQAPRARKAIAAAVANALPTDEVFITLSPEFIIAPVKSAKMNGRGFRSISLSHYKDTAFYNCMQVGTC